MSDDELYMTSTLGRNEAKKHERVEDDFFAFHDDPFDEKPKKKKKKKKTKKDYDASNESLPGAFLHTSPVGDEVAVTSQQYGENSRAGRPGEKADSMIAARDVTPPPGPTIYQQNGPSTNARITPSKRRVLPSSPDIDLPELIDEVKDQSTEFEFQRTTLKKKKFGLKERFVLSLDLRSIDEGSSMVLEVNGSALVEKIMNTVQERFNLNTSRQPVFVFDDLKLHKSSQICHVLLIEPAMAKNSEGKFSVSLSVMYNDDYETSRKCKEASLKDAVEQKDEDDTDWDRLKLNELEKMAAEQLRHSSEVVSNVNTQKPNDPSFHIILRKGEKDQFRIVVNPEMKIADIKKMAQAQLNIKECQLFFDDDEMNMDEFVKDTELEEDFIIDIIAK